MRPQVGKWSRLRKPIRACLAEEGTGFTFYDFGIFLVGKIGTSLIKIYSGITEEPTLFIKKEDFNEDNIQEVTEVAA